MSAWSLLAQVRDLRGSITCDGTRLIIEAPAGAITAKLRIELSKHKRELIAMLAPGTGNIRDDAEVIGARSRIARLLGVAYGRMINMKSAGDHQPSQGVHELANSRHSSVHGVVP